MDIKVDHSQLSMTDLHHAGIRSTAWLEEALDDGHSKIFEITQATDPHPVFFKVGFSDSLTPILYIFEFTDRILSRQARKASKEEISNFWCH